MPKIPPGLDFPAPPAPPTGWDWRFKDKLNRQNPMLAIVGGKTYLATDRSLGVDIDLDDDEKKKEKRKREIMAANRNRRRSRGSKTSIASGTGTVTPILNSYPSGFDGYATTGGGFSLSDVPSIVWIILAVGVGIFLIKSARRK